MGLDVRSCSADSAKQILNAVAYVVLIIGFGAQASGVMEFRVLGSGS